MSRHAFPEGLIHNARTLLTPGFRLPAPVPKFIYLYDKMAAPGGDFRIGYYFLSQGIIDLNCAPTFSIRWSLSLLARALNCGRLAIFSSIHSLANEPL